MSDDFKERDEEAQRMRGAGHELAAAAHAMEGLIDDDGLTVEQEAQDQAAMVEEMGKLRDDHLGPIPDDDDEGYAETAREADDSEEADEGDTDDEAGEDGPARLELDDATLDAEVTVKIAGEDRQVSLREALQGYSRQADYTRKTSELAQQRRQLEALRDQHQEAIEFTLQGISDRLTPDQQTALVQNFKRIQAEKAQDQQAALQKRKKEEQAKLAEAMNWTDAKPEDVKSEQAQLRETAEAYGYTADEITNSVDHRAFLMLRDAMKYRQMTAKGEAVRAKAKKSPVLKPGSKAPRGSSEKRAREEATKRLSKTGSIQDAAAAFEALGLVD